MRGFWCGIGPLVERYRGRLEFKNGEKPCFLFEIKAKLMEETAELLEQIRGLAED